MKVRLEFKLPDMWVGAFWRVERRNVPIGAEKTVDLWVCLVPMFPIHFTWNRIYHGMVWKDRTAVRYDQ